MRARLGKVFAPRTPLVTNADHFLILSSSPLGIAFQLVCLAFAVYHSATWFAVTPKAMPPLVVRGERVPARTIVGVHYGLWALISILVLVAARI
jgi:succinate dehydrogenase subunit C